MSWHDDVVRGPRHARPRMKVRLYLSLCDPWIGMHVGKMAIYVCLLPCVVIWIGRGPVPGKSRRASRRA